MGIYLPNMEMPKPKLANMATVYDAYILVSPNGHAVIVVENEDGLDSTEFPLIPVPPHGRLGDLDKLEQMFVDIDNAPYSGFDGSEPFYSAEDAAQIIRLAPTIIPTNEEET